MPSILRVTLLSAVCVAVAGSANRCEAGPFWDWLMGRPSNVQYAPTTVGYFPSGAYYGAGPAASYYRAPAYSTGYAPSNYAPSNYAPSNYAPSNYAPSAPNSYATTANYAPTSPSSGAAIIRPYPVTANRPVRADYYPSEPTTTFYRAPRTTYYRAPVTTFYREAPTTNYYQPAPAYRRGPLGLFNWPVRAVGGLSPSRPVLPSSTAAPRTSYRPTWTRVPVTYYRPVTQVDPVTGQQVQRMQPCTTYRWQVQQSPTLVRRAPAAGAWSAPVDCPPSTTVPAGAVEATPSDDPYYGGSRIMRPRDEGLIPKDAEILRDERIDPADERPRLNGRPPESGDLSSTRTRGVERQGLPTGSTRSLTEKPFSPPAATRPSGKTRSNSLLRDPEGDDGDYPEPPPLLRPRDRTAALGSAVRVVAYEAQWPTPAKPVVQRVERSGSTAAPTRIPKATSTRTTTRRQSAPVKRLDDTGWKSLRP